jgi:hypothetical protein
MTGRSGQKLREEGGRGKIPILFPKHIFKTKFKSSLNSFAVLIKPNHLKNKYAAA